MRRIIRVLLAATMLATVGATAALAHAGHQPLPPGFASRVIGVVDVAGNPVELPGVTWEAATDGMGLTVVTNDPRMVEVAGEQAGEPFLRVAADEAFVNIRSPQAADVTGADVDPTEAAELVDILQGAAPPEWVALDEGGTVHWIDHRPIGHSHAPDRAAYTTGERSEEWEVGFTLDGVPYRMAGEVVATGSDPVSPALLVAGGFGVVALLGGGWVTLRRRRMPATA